MKKITSMLLVSALLLASCGDIYYEAPVDNTNEIITSINLITQTTMKSNVAIYTDSFVGSGVVFKAEEIKNNSKEFIFYILTNHHVISEFLDGKSETLDLVSFMGFSYEPLILAHNETVDLALLSVIGMADEFYVSELSNLTVSSRDIIFSMGTPQGQINALTVGRVLDPSVSGTVDGIYYEALINHSALVDSGNSGGALVNSKGKIVGINVMAPIDEEPVFPYNSVEGYALPYKIINSFLTENGYSRLLN